MSFSFLDRVWYIFSLAKLSYPITVAMKANLPGKLEMTLPMRKLIRSGTLLGGSADLLFTQRFLNINCFEVKSAEKFSYGFQNLVKLGVGNINFKFTIGTTFFNFLQNFGFLGGRCSFWVKNNDFFENVGWRRKPPDGERAVKIQKLRFFFFC